MTNVTLDLTQEDLLVKMYDFMNGEFGSQGHVSDWQAFLNYMYEEDYLEEEIYSVINTAMKQVYA